MTVDPTVATMVVLGVASGVTTITIAAMKLVPKLWNGKVPSEPPASRAELAAEHDHSNGAFVRKDFCGVVRGEMDKRLADVQTNVAETRKDVRLILRHLNVPEADED